MASSLYNDKNSNLQESEKWGEMVNHLFDLFKTQKPLQMHAALRMLENILDQTCEKLNVFAAQLKELVIAGFNSGQLNVQLGTFKLLCSIVI